MPSQSNVERIVCMGEEKKREGKKETRPYTRTEQKLAYRVAFPRLKMDEGKKKKERITKKENMKKKERTKEEKKK